jgi:hypothetical protein
MSAKPKKVVIKKSTDPKKKLEAKFFLDNGRTKTVRFGQAGAPDYTTKKGTEKERRSRYLTRHRARENWNSPMTAGALSRWILWEKPTRREAIQAYKKRFNLS